MNIDLSKKRAWKERKIQADAIRGVRTILRTPVPRAVVDANGTELFVKRPILQNVAFFGLIIGVCLIGSCSIPKEVHAEITTENAIHAIIGEAENQGDQGMLAVACALHNRGTLKGVYGLKSPRVLNHKYSKRTAQMASMVWTIATQTPDYCGFVKGATGWGNTKDGQEFAKAKWWKNCVVVYRHKDHFFYRVKGA